MFYRKAKTAFALGLPSLLRVGLYRLGLRLGCHPVLRLNAVAPTGPCFAEADIASMPPHPPPSTAWSDAAEYFGWLRVPLHQNAPPDWHVNPFNGARSASAASPWWTIPDVDPVLGDIKAVWEASRWDWVLHATSRARAGDATAIPRLNAWLADWFRANPPYLGANWKCGQEASIRLLHLALGAVILNQHLSGNPHLAVAIRLHLQRIAPTIHYAVAQNNNHGTSEAAALFVGGTWLERVAPDRHASRWAAAGRKWLENRVGALVATDGSFSQYSVNYHRLLLDTLCTTELWRRALNLPRFSARFLARARAATHWLGAFVEPGAGDAPNLGANDGAWLLPLGAASPRDFRPSLQLASALFNEVCLFSEGPWNDALRFLGIAIPSARTPPAPAPCHLFDHGGFAILHRGPARVFVRYPRFRFRPSHADALHLDFWLGARNILRDGGSMSYADDRWNAHFQSVASHNTVQFDAHDQMPRLGRFLYGAWLRDERVNPPCDDGEAISFAAGYQDWRRSRHRRKILLSSKHLQVVDDVQGFQRSAVLRWRLIPGAWQLHPHTHTLTLDDLHIAVSASMPIRRLELVEGHESRLYQRVDALPVLEVEVDQAGRLNTTVAWDGSSG